VSDDIVEQDIGAEDRRGLVEGVRRLVEEIEPVDLLERGHRAEAMSWLGTTTDVFRSTSTPVAPVRHLVSYFLLIDEKEGSVLLGDHIKSGLWLPSGGHVEPGEHPANTVRRECFEELGVDAEFLSRVGERPLFITITDTVGSADVHNDVSLWFCLSGSRSMKLKPDPGEYVSVRWWRYDEVHDTEPGQFDPGMGRMLKKLTEIGESRCLA